MKFFLYAVLLVAVFCTCQRMIHAGNKSTKNSSTTTADTTNLVKRAGIKRYYLDVDGDSRTFLVQLPEGYDPAQAYPVIFFFHSIHGRDTSWIKGRGANVFVDKYKYIAVYGQGANGGIWNIGGYYPLKKVNEIKYVMAMYDWLKQNTNVDTKRVYAVGTSNGALLAHYLAIQTNIFAAIVAISGSLYTDEMRANTPPTAMLQVHGMQDKTIPYNGGFTKYNYTFLSAENSVKTWAANNGCNEKPVVSNLLNGKIVVTSYTNCKNGKPAILYSIPSAAHKVSDSIDLQWLFEQVFSFLSENKKQ